MACKEFRLGLVLLGAFLCSLTSDAQIFVFAPDVPGILYAPLAEPRNDTDIMAATFTAIPLPKGSRVGSIDYDPQNQLVYWANFGADSISRMQLDGTNVQQDMISTNSPHSIALDLANGKIYWTLYNSRSIGRADLDGGAVETIYTYPSTVGFIQPTSISVTPGYIYWSTRITNQVVRAAKPTPTQNLTSPTLLQPINAEGMDIELCADKTSRLFYFSNHSRLGVMNGDGTANRTLQTLQNPMLGGGLNKYGRKIFWSADDFNDVVSLYEYDLQLSIMIVADDTTVTLADGTRVNFDPSTLKIVSEDPYDEPVAIINCPDDIVVVINDDDPDITMVSWTEPILNSFSSCPTMEFVGPGSNGGNFSLGTVEVSYNAKDTAGNVDVCTFTVTVRQAGEESEPTDAPKAGGCRPRSSATTSTMSPIITSMFVIIALLKLAMQ